MALINTEEIVEKSIFLSIEKILVREGYIPDITLFPDLYGNDDAAARVAQIAYDNAVKSIVANKGFSIELFNYSETQAKGERKVPRIVINTQGFYPGSIGKDSTANYVKNQANDGYIREYDGQKTSDMYLNIYLVANSIKQIRTLHAILSASIPRHGYIPRWEENEDFQLEQTGNLFIEYVSFNESDDENRGVIEKAYRYLVPDVVENELIIDNTDIAKIESIDYLDNQIIVE